MYPIIEVEVDCAKATFRSFNAACKMTAKDLRDYANHLLSLADRMEKIDKALVRPPDDIPF